MLAPPADRDERHLCIDELAERSADALASVAVAGTHATIACPATLAGSRGQ